jgi:Tfp pilus assembly protein PilF
MEHYRPLEAITALEPARPYELAGYTILTQRAGAYLQARQPENAASEYKKILANPGVDPVSSMFPLAHLGLARAYVLQGDSARSRDEYQKFFDLWKDADADVPVLRQARLEYSYLR